MSIRLFLFAIIVFPLSASRADERAWIKVQKSSAPAGIPLSGRVVPQDGALNIVSARVQGRVISILKREGDPVSDGTPLYSISSAECFTLQEERRVAVSKNLSELIEGVQKRERQLGMQLVNDQCYAVAGNAGVLTKRSLEAGASFNPGDPIATILDPRRLTIELDVPERDQAQVRPGTRVSFRFASRPETAFTSEVQTTVPTIDPMTRTSKARLRPVRFPTNVSLEALVFGEAKTPQGESLLQVPSTALAFSKGEQYVISGNEEHPRPVPVSVISETDNLSTVRPKREGDLKEGDSVAASGAIFLLQKLQSESGH